MEDMGFSIADKEDDDDDANLYMTDKNGKAFVLMRLGEDQVFLYYVMSIPEDNRWEPERMKMVIQQLSEEYLARIMIVENDFIASVASFHANSARSFRNGIPYAINEATSIARTFAIMMNTKQ